MKYIATLLAAATFAASVIPAGAVVVGRTNPALLALNNALVNVQVQPGIVVTPFNLPTARTVAISFSATCQVSGINGFVQIDIVVDGIVRSPTIGPLDRFCSSDGTVLLDNASVRSITIPVALAAGAHQLIIRAQTVGAGIVANFDDSATVIQD